MSSEEVGNVEMSLVGPKMRRKFNYNSVRPLPKVAISRTSSVESSHSTNSSTSDRNNGLPNSTKEDVNWEKVAKEAKQREYVVRDNVRSLMQNVNQERAQLQKLVHHYKKLLQQKENELANASKGGENKEADTLAYLKLLRENSSLKSELEKEREKSLNLQKELENMGDPRNSSRSRSNSNENSAASQQLKKRVSELEHENATLEAKLSAANLKLSKASQMAKQEAEVWTTAASPPTKPQKSPVIRTQRENPQKQARNSANLGQKKKLPVVLLAMHDFESEDPEDLPFAEGDLLTLIEREEEEGDGWWTAEFAGKKGKIPSNFVEDLSEIIPVQMVAIGSFKGECEGDLEFKRGEFINILNQEDEWWIGQKMDGTTGYLPRNYVQPLE